MRKIFRKIFRYKLTSIFFIIGQLIIYITIFGALAVYNRAYDKEKDRINAVYKNRIELEINMSKKADFMSFFADSTNTGNAVISGKLALGIQELGTSVRSEIIIMSNEQMNYKLESGRLPGENAKNGRLEVAVGRNKAKFATVENGKKYLVIEGDRYEISGILGSDKSDYWDNKVVLNIACLGDKTLNSLMKKMSYTVELGSNSYELDDTYKTVYGNIKSIDQDSVIKAKKLISNGENILISFEEWRALKEQILAKAKNNNIGGLISWKEYRYNPYGNYTELDEYVIRLQNQLLHIYEYENQIQANLEQLTEERKEMLERKAQEDSKEDEMIGWKKILGNQYSLEESFDIEAVLENNSKVLSHFEQILKETVNSQKVGKGTRESVQIILDNMQNSQEERE